MNIILSTRFGWGAIKNEALEIGKLVLAMVATRIFAFTQAMVVMVILGRYSGTEMAGMSMATAVSQVLIVLGFSMMIGAETEIAKRHGAGNNGGAVQFLMSSYLFAFIVGLLMVVLALSAGHLIVALKLSEKDGYGEAIDVTLSAIKVIAIGFPAFCLYLTSSYYFEATCQPKIETMLAVLGLVVAVGCALILIPDRLGLGISPGFGAAWSLTAMRIVQATVSVSVVTWKTGKEMKRQAGQLFRCFWMDAKDLLSIGIPMSLADCTTTVAVSLMTFMVGSLGSSALNVYQMSSHFLAVMMLIGSGLVSGVTIRVTNAIGAKDIDKENLSLSGGLLLLIFVDAIILSIYLLFPASWASIYKTTSELTAFVAWNQIWALLVFLIECPLMLLIGIGRAKGLTGKLPTIKAMCFVFISLPITYMIITRAAEPRPMLLASLVPTVAAALVITMLQFRKQMRRE